ncbi:MAG TPA: branched-chain amino acid ABC transporter permease [Streptosporangiaceae bacterium]|nr:branched-chain amino acid ABC transporter permease [Streptosporangiaceae bacterium]
MTLFLTALFAGLAVGSVYGLIALSYTVVFNSTAIFNVAQGDLMMAGVLVAYFCLDRWHLAQILTLLIIISVVVSLSLVEERVAVRPFVKRPVVGLGWFIATLAFSLILETIASIIYGQNPVVPIPSALGNGSLRVAGVHVANKFILAFVTMIVILVALEVFYKRTWLGTAMRGVAEDREVAALRGIDALRISRLAFIIAGLVTGLAAFVVAPIVSADVTVGLTYGLKGFIALAVGGFGSLRGCVIGGLLLGVAEQMFDLYVSSNYEILAALILVLLVLAVRPSGLFGRTAVREV